MPVTVRSVSYFYCVVSDRPGEAYRMLTQLAAGDVNLFAFNAIPMGPANTQLVLFPEDPDQLRHTAERAGLRLSESNPALLVQGDDELGALVDLHAKLYDAQVNVYASHGVTDGKGAFGYILYVRPEDFDRAVQALGL